MLHVEHLRHLLLTAPSQPGRPAHLGAASGLVAVDDYLYVVADDELQLGQFPRSGNAPGTLLPLLPGTLPLEHGPRKKSKPDLEALALLPPGVMHPEGALLALGSGSETQRRRCAIIPLCADGRLQDAARIFQPDHWYQQLEGRLGALNLEGAWVQGDELILLQRGNDARAGNAVLRLSLADFLHQLQGGTGPDPLQQIIPVALGTLEGVPLSFTDGAALDGGNFIFSAVAENTDDNYHDGECLGTVLGIATLGGQLLRIEPLARPCKVEGMAVLQKRRGIDLLLVTDADDETVPASLLSAHLS